MRATLHLVAATDYPAFEAATSRTAQRCLGAHDPTRHRRAPRTDARRLPETPRTLAELEAFADEAAMTVDGSSLADHAPGGVTRVTFGMVSARGGLVHVPPSGHWRSHGKARYVAAPSLDMPDEDAAMAESVVRYLRAYGPASVADFGQWSGQRRVTSKAAIDRLGDRLVTLRGEDGRELVDLAELRRRERRRAGTGPLPRALGQPACELRRSSPHHRRRAPAGGLQEERRHPRDVPRRRLRGAGRGPRRSSRASRRSTSRQW